MMSDTLTLPRRAKTLCGIELPEPEATALAVANLAAYMAAGIKIRHGWGSRGPYDLADIAPQLDFLDHTYRIVPRDRSVIYVAEPYGVSLEGLCELAGLAERGWGVCIGEHPLWYPGRTTPILMWKE
jgi:hypothetical protein